jgi:hypothetical protein
LSSEVALNRHWTIELGYHRHPQLSQKNSINDLDSSISNKKLSQPSGLHVSIKESASHNPGRKTREDARAHGQFYSTYKPLQDVTFKSQGEKCFYMLDKKAEVSNSENKKEKLVQADSGLLLLIEVADSKKHGVRHINFNSLIQIKSELDFQVKIELDCENLERTIFDLNPCTIL